MRYDDRKYLQTYDTFKNTYPEMTDSQLRDATLKFIDKYGKYGDRSYYEKLNNNELVKNMYYDINKKSLIPTQEQKVFQKDVTSNDYLESLANTAYKNYANLIVDPNSAAAQQYLADMRNSIYAEQSAYNNELANLEIDAYKQIGLQQQELENQIAESRLKAIKSGTTSAQLAAQQLNNMFAAQSGAAQIAQAYADKRLEAAQTYNQMRNTNLTTSLYDMINNNRTALATAGAQNYAVAGSYGSYVNQQLANYQAASNMYDYLGKKKYQAVTGG